MAEKSEGTKLRPELVAIFRLEFYRKQKNWKFCQDIKGKTPPDTTDKENPKHILNKTYNIDMKLEPDIEPEPVPEPESESGGRGEGDQEEEVSELNQAFIDAGTDRNPPDSDPPTALSSQIWYNTALMQTQQDPDWDSQIHQKPEFQQDVTWHEDLQEWYPTPEYTPASGNWPRSWPPPPRWEHDAASKLDYSEVGPQIVDLDSGSGEPRDSWLEHKHLSAPTMYHMSHSETSLESLSEFVRGASSGPHSSELDLMLSADDAHKHTLIIYEGCDEYPTRDTEPSCGAHDFIAGSFMNVAEGRGRGRLRRERGEVIRIGMGRPYRLK